MMTLRQLAQRPAAVPAATALLLADLAEAHGRHEAVKAGLSERLEALREAAQTESVLASGRLDGLSVDASRVGTILFGNPLLLGRDEEELRGAREALELLERAHGRPAFSEACLRRLHRLVRRRGGGRYAGGDATEARVSELVELTRACLAERWVHPLVTIAAVPLDLLCLGPFGDGDGRVARLAFRQLLAQGGYDVGRYVSLERLVEDSRERHAATLLESSRGWEDGWHNPWPYTNYLLVILRSAYQELSRRLEHAALPKRTKLQLVRAAIEAAEGKFTLAGLMRSCPGVSEETVHGVLRGLRDRGRVECLGRGPGAPWRRIG